MSIPLNAVTDAKVNRARSRLLIRTRTDAAWSIDGGLVLKPTSWDRGSLNPTFLSSVPCSFPSFRRIACRGQVISVKLKETYSVGLSPELAETPDGFTVETSTSNISTL